MSASVGLSFAVHYVSFMLFIGMLTADLAYMDLPPHHTYAGRMKFLTFLSFICDMAYFNFAAIIDFLIWTRGKDSPLWKYVRDFFFSAILFPVASFVCVMFWAIYLNDSSALRTEEEVKIIPWWIDHGFHTLPILIMFFQAFIIEHTYPRKRVAFISLLVVVVLYVSWMFWIAHKANFWVYPLLERMSFFGILVFIVFSTTIILGFYLVGKKFTDIVWKKDKKKAL